MEVTTIQNEQGFLFAKGDKVRHTAERGTVGEVLHLLHELAYVLWPDPKDTGWFHINELEPLDAP